MSDGPTSLSRRERERRRRRQAMLKAAQSVFAEKGYSRATLDEIAERAEFGKGTLYNYFEGGKEEMLFAIFESIYEDLCELIRSVFQEAAENNEPLHDAFHTFVKSYFRFFREREDLFMILIKEAHLMAFSDDSERVQFFHEQLERMVNELTPILEDAIEREEIQSLPPHSVAHLLLANVRGIVIHSTLNECPEACAESPVLDEPEKAADFLTSMLFDGLSLSPTPLFQDTFPNE